MKNKLFTLLIATLFLSACGQAPVAKITPTPTPKLVEMPIESRPIIGLTPRSDGRMLYLKISQIPSDIVSIEYEVLYNAIDNNSEIEKGLGDTIKDVSSTIERNLLLGTESCTNGCKYKYDEGVKGGTTIITFINQNGQVSTFESPFVFRSGKDLTKEGQLTLETENFSVKPKDKLNNSDYFVLMKNYRGGFSVYSNANHSIVGDYPQP